MSAHDSTTGSETQTVIALIAIRQGRTRTPAGKPVTLDASEAARLIAQGSARHPLEGELSDTSKDDETQAPKDGDAPKAGDGPDTDRAERIRLFVETQIADSDWTAAGTPKVAAVEKATGLSDVSADELADYKRAEA